MSSEIPILPLSEGLSHLEPTVLTPQTPTRLTEAPVDDIRVIDGLRSEEDPNRPRIYYDFRPYGKFPLTRQILGL
jgi:hypothetical protein